MTCVSKLRRKICASFAVAALSACGTYVPRVEEAYEVNPPAEAMEIKIKQKIYCELKNAIVELNNNPDRAIHVGDLIKKPVPESWGVLVNIQLIVIENSALSPGVSVISPAPSKFFKLALGGVASSEATRTDKFTFYYLIKDLQEITRECEDVDVNNMPGSSLLLASKLGIFDWLNLAIGVRDNSGISAKSKQEVLSYDVKFDVVTSGNITPSWTLARVAADASPLFSSKRERTHELTLTFGPAEEQTSSKGKKTLVAQPAPIVLFDNLATQFRSATTDGFRASRF